MLTPQAIKDQEFQIKFRGFDAIEVKAYLELLAEDFFDLTEQNRAQAEELEALAAEQVSLQREKESLAAEVKISQENTDGIQAEIQEGYKHKDKEIGDLQKELKTMAAALSELEEENGVYAARISELEEQLAGDRGITKEEQDELKLLRARLEVLEEQNRELKKEGLDFKTTILAAQKFSDDLRTSSEEKARNLIEETRSEVEIIRTEAEKELVRLPEEIKELTRRKQQVREDLRVTLQKYMETLDLFEGSEPVDKEDDLSDLFQSIQIPGDGEDSDREDIDKINMDLS
jgi:DivIVA domain-containing protein